jgi:DNA (cytosine-5)-methyltransferase 1
MANVVIETLPFDTTQVTSPQNGNNPKWGDPCHPLAAQGHTPTVICLQGSMLGRSDKNGPQGDGVNEETCFTLNTIDRHAVVYADTYQKVTGPLMANSHPGSYTGQDAYTDMLIVGKTHETRCYDIGEARLRTPSEYVEVSPTITARCGTGGNNVPAVCGVNIRAGIEYPELYPTLQAKSTGGHSLNYSGVVRARYIVRRLTPTECARLQGFADHWGWIDQKDSLTDEEFFFWRDVRNTHALINGREEKGYSKTQMLNWYNKLHTDSAEYKMWGNGIALPPALYCLQGITIALNAEEDDAWMD